MLKIKNLLNSSAAKHSLLAGLSVAAGLAFAANANADEARRCLDTQCHYLSLPYLEAILGTNNADAGQASGDNLGTVAKTFGTWGFDTQGMNKSVKPGDDFFAYANGSAIDAMVIPSDRTSYGSFNALAELSQNRLKVLVEKIAASSNHNADEAKIANLYNGVMNVNLRNSLDYSPIAPHLKAIGAIKTKTQMARYMGKTAYILGSSLFGPAIFDDLRDPTFNTLYIGQGGLSLPDRDYYLDDKFKAKKVKYEAYIADQLGRIGYENAAASAKAIVDFETEIAKVSWTKIEQRDPVKIYNPTTWAKMAQYAPGFAWGEFAQGAGLAKAKKVVMGENTAIAKIAKIYAQTPLATIKAWQVFKTLDAAAPMLSQRFVDANWGFWSRDLSGTKTQRPLWKKAIAITENNLGEVLGKTYVSAYFPEDSKTKMVGLVAELRVALKARIEGLTWMSSQTRAKALEKLAKFTVKIGYPDTWRDYSKLKIKPDDLIGNVERSGAFQWKISLDKLGKPVDRSEWGMTPQTVNAYYSPTGNEIVFPAAILQPPFFDPNADMAVNFGGIGGVIGHEMTHGFDDQGRQFAGDGSLTDWWQADDAKKFEAQTKNLGAQYDAYEPIPGAKVQGGLTMGENIADLGGILLGLDAYRLSLKGADAPVIDGFSGEQRVMLGWAQVWRSKYRDDAVRQQVVSDPHSPAQFRVSGTVRNVDAWYSAFDVKEGDKNYIKPQDRVKIW